MADDLTPWEEINPPMASAQRRGQLSECSDQARAVFRNELTACLALTAPAGMTEESRGEWLAVAWDTLKHIPADILASGTRAARMKCDHPSKIVPTIIAETNSSLGFRRRMDEWDQRAQALPAPTYPPIPHEETQRILREVSESLTAPGSKPLVETGTGSIAKQREPDQRPDIRNYPTKPVE